jgi:hypothetical protein
MSLYNRRDWRLRLQSPRHRPRQNKSTSRNMGENLRNSNTRTLCRVYNHNNAENTEPLYAINQYIHPMKFPNETSR